MKRYNTVARRAGYDNADLIIDTRKKDNTK